MTPKPILAQEAQDGPPDRLGAPRTDDQARQDARLLQVAAGGPDFTHGSPEEYYYCCWVRDRKPAGDAAQMWACWLEERQAYMQAQPAWVMAWRRSLAAQRALREQEPT